MNHDNLLYEYSKELSEQNEFDGFPDNLITLEQLIESHRKLRMLRIATTPKRADVTDWSQHQTHDPFGKWYLA